MSSYLKNVNKFSKEFNIDTTDKIKLYMAYPIVRFFWLVKKNRLTNTFSRVFSSFAKIIYFKIKLTSKYNDTSFLTLRMTSGDIESFKEIFFGGEYDSSLNIKDCRTFIDCGSNNGMVPFYFSTKASIEKILAIEANPLLIEGLKENFKGISSEIDCCLENVCITGNENGQIPFYISDDHRMSSMSSFKDAKKVMVNALPLRELISLHFDKEIDILKMDIEGAEFDILKKDPSVFKMFKNIFIEIHGVSSSRNEFVSSLMAQGFRLVERKQYDWANCETSILTRE